MDIYNDEQLRTAIMQDIIYPLQQELAKKITLEVQQYIYERAKKNGGAQKLSTRTMRECTTYDIKKNSNGYTSTIYIDDDAMQEQEEPYAYGNFSKFMSLGMRSTWEKDGMSISYHLVQWLEETGARGVLGNNPIRPIHMFANVYRMLESKIPMWINQIGREYGVVIQRG